MALATDASSPAITTQTSGTTATVATASFTPPANSVLAIGWTGNTGSASDPAAPSITDSLVSHLTYALVGWKHRTSPAPTIDGQAAMWRAIVGASPLPMTVTVTTGTGSGAQQASLKVWVETGADTTTPIGASGATGSASAASIAQSYTASATGGQVFGTVCDWDLKGVQTAGTGTTRDGSANVGTDISYGFFHRTLADDVSGVSNTLNITIPGTSTNLSWVYAEVLPAAGGTTATWLPSPAPRRRTPARPARSRTVETQPAQAAPVQAGQDHRLRLPALRTRARAATPVREQVNPPYPIAEDAQPRRLRGMPGRRSRVAMPPWPQQSPPVNPDWIQTPRRPRQTPEILRRNHVWMPPWPPQAPATAPLWIPAGHRPRPQPVPPRRDRAVAPPATDAPVPPGGHRPRPMLAPARRDRLSTVVPAAAPFVPGVHRPRLVEPALRPRRQERLVLVLVVAPANPPIVLLQPHHRTLALPVRRRGRVFAVPLEGAEPTVCIVVRPNTGTVTRGATGTVTRPNTGIVEHCSCCT